MGLQPLKSKRKLMMSVANESGLRSAEGMKSQAQLRRLEKHLEKQAQQYEESVKIQRFVESVQQNLDKLSDVRIQDTGIESWLKWARMYSAQLNPQVNGEWRDIEKQVPLWEIREYSY